MLAYIARRLALIPLTLLGIMTINFLFAQAAPGGPVEQMMMKIDRIGGGEASSGGGSIYRGADGVREEFRAKLVQQYGFDRPAYERFFQMIRDYLRFDFGKSFYQDRTVTALVLEKMPVSMSLGLWSTLLIYLISIPLGIAKAVRHGSRFDLITSWAVVIGYAVPGFLVGLALIVLFAGGSYWAWFPLRGLTSPGAEAWPFWARVGDYFWHLVLPVTALVVGGFASLTMLTKNCFLDEIHKHYVLTARAKGASPARVLYRHIFRNAMLLVVAGFPAALVSILFTGSMLIEVMFSLDGLGLLGFEAVINRDFPVMFATLYVFGLIGLILNLISDLTYHWVDPRIDFEAR